MAQLVNLETLATRYWAITVLLLAAAIGDLKFGYAPVIALTMFQWLHFYMRENSFTAFSVQVRIAYLIILLVSMLPFLFWIAWIQLIGTAVRVIFNYCFLARTVSLLPWNRSQPLSIQLIKRTYLTPPTSGSILQALAEKNVESGVDLKQQYLNITNPQAEQMATEDVK